jgi:hypothetical protein
MDKGASCCGARYARELLAPCDPVAAACRLLISLAALQNFLLLQQLLGENVHETVVNEECPSSHGIRYRRQFPRIPRTATSTYLNRLRAALFPH